MARVCACIFASCATRVCHALCNAPEHFASARLAQCPSLMVRGHRATLYKAPTFCTKIVEPFFQAAHWCSVRTWHWALAGGARGCAIHRRRVRASRESTCAAHVKEVSRGGGAPKQPSGFVHARVRVCMRVCLCARQRLCWRSSK